MTLAINIREGAAPDRVAKFAAAGTYIDHQPGDGTRYEIAAFAVGGGMHLGLLGYVSEDAIVVICGNSGRAYLFRTGDTVSEMYIEEKFGLTNPHTIHHITELVARAIEGTVVGCTHE